MTLTPAMKKMAASSVLIVGLQGLGAEIGIIYVHARQQQKLTVSIKPKMLL